MKKLIKIVLSLIMILSFSITTYANEVDNPVEPIDPDEYVETSISYKSGYEVKGYVNGCMVGATPYFTSGTIRYNTNGYAWSSTVGWGANITFFSRETGVTYTVNDASATLTNVSFYVENHVLKVSFKVRITVGGSSVTLDHSPIILKTGVY